MKTMSIRSMYVAVLLFLLMAMSACTIGNAPSFSLNPVSLQMTVGEMATIEPVGTASGIVWTSSNDSVATVFSGVVTAKAIGAATITATSGKTSVSCPVYVLGTDGASLRITPAAVSLKPGETYQLQYGNAYELPLTWTSSNDSVAQVSADGVVTARKGGLATITLATNIESVSAIVSVEHQWGAYQLVWSDEFEGTTLDESVWTIQTGGGGWGRHRRR